MIHYFLPADQGWAHMLAYLEDWGGPVREWFRLRSYEELLDGAESGTMRFERGTYILSSLDQLTPAMLKLVADVHRQLVGLDGFRFLNDPARTMRRYELMNELHRLGRSAFRAVRATGPLDGLRYPVFIRGERSHDGPLSPLLRSPREVEAALGRVMTMRGRRPRDLLVVEFCPTADATGAYRKYAAFVVGDRILARSLEAGREWIVKHDTTEWSRSTLRAERDYVYENPHAGPLAEIVRIAGVGYGRVDYAMKDGRIQVWEINLHPAIGRRGPGPLRNPVPAELAPIRQESKERFYRAFQAALEAVDVRGADRPPVAVELDRPVVRAARSRPVRRWRSWRALIGLLRPARPLLEPVAAPLFPLLGRLARRSGRAPAATDPFPTPVTRSPRGGSAASSGRTSTASGRGPAGPPPRAGR